MRSFFKCAALLAVGASALPAHHTTTAHTSTATTAHTSKASTLTGTTTATAPQTSESIFKYPLKNGFPNIKAGSKELAALEQRAAGTLPNTPLPSKIAPESAQFWQLIAFNEFYEVAVFTEIIRNITDQVPGYEVPADQLDYMLGSLKQIHAQEQLHALGANAILAAAGEKTIEPCEYHFPVNNLDEAIGLAFGFTDVFLGTLQEALAVFDAEGDGQAFSKLVGSVIGQEGEQDGFFRGFFHEYPSELPFLTQASGIFTYSLIQQVATVAGTCSSNSIIKFPVLEVLLALTQDISNTTTSIDYSFTPKGDNDLDNLHLVYVNQQNTPIVEPLNNMSKSNGVVTFSAAFPYEQYLLQGLTLAVVTNSPGPFANATEVSLASVYGPVPIDI